jgi:hypothetical protein
MLATFLVPLSVETKRHSAYPSLMLTYPNLMCAVCLLTVAHSMFTIGAHAAPQDKATHSGPIEAAAVASNAIVSIDVQTDTLEEESTWTFPVVPIIAYSDETSAMIGAIFVKPHRWESSASNTTPNTLAMSAYGTLRDQWGIGLMPSFYLNDEAYVIRTAGYIHHSAATFWGVGNEAGEEDDNEEDFVAEGYGLWFRFMKRVCKNLWIGPSGRFGYATMESKVDEGLLDEDAVVGSDAGIISGMGVALEWDDRDSVFWPSSGGYHQAFAQWYGDELGSDYAYREFGMDLRQFIPLSERQVLGVQLITKYQEGNAPFYTMGMLGGVKVLRGIYEGRFRDKAMVAVQTEYRALLSERLGVAVFVGAGEVAETFSEFTKENIRLAGGVGLRVVLDPKDLVTLRIDVAVSEYGIAPTLMVTEAF